MIAMTQFEISNCSGNNLRSAEFLYFFNFVNSNLAPRFLGIKRKTEG